MANEYRLDYTASDINEKLGKIEEKYTAAAKAKVDTLFRTLVLAVSLSAAAVVLVLFIVLRIRHRMTRRRREMDELAAMYENEDTE